MVGDCPGADAEREHTHDAVAHGDGGDVVGHLCHDAGALAGQERVARIHAERDQYVAEVEPDGTDVDSYLTRGEFLRQFGVGQQRQVVQRAGGRLVQSPGRVVRNGERAVGAVGRTRQPGCEELEVTNGELVLASGEGVGQVRRVRQVVGVDEVDTAGVLVLRAADQAPQGRVGEMDVLGRAGGHGVPGEDDQAAVAGLVGGQP